MPRPITVDEVASFPYSGIAPSELSPDCELSADGLRVAYTHQTRIHITELKTSNTYESFKGRSPKWSPVQPDILAFLKPKNSGVWLRYPDGSERQLAGNTENVSFFQWCLDGKFIALIANRDLENQDEDADDDIVIVLPPPLTSVNSIVILHVECNEVAPLLESSPGESYDELAWHPDGNWITVLSSIESRNQRDVDYYLFGNCLVHCFLGSSAINIDGLFAIFSGVQRVDTHSSGS